MATSGFQINGAELTQNWPDRAYLMDRYPELADTFKQAGLWVSGLGNNGYLGTNDNVWRSSPVQTIAGGGNWKLVSAGQYLVASIKTDGTLWTWGQNNHGQLGTNNTTARQSPVQTISAGTDWKVVTCGLDHVTSIKTDGTLWSWGLNDKGQLGDNSLVKKSSPVQIVGGGTNWKFVSAGINHVGAIKTNGTLWMWGNDFYGETGNNNGEFGLAYSSPVQTISAGTNWRLVSCGWYYTTAIKTDGTLWLWGRNQYGQLATNNTTNRSSPVQTISGGTDWKLVSAGKRHVAAIKTDGTLWLWGSNTYGQLGNNDSGTNRSSPVQTFSAGTNWKIVGAHLGDCTGGIKTDGTLWVWGANHYGHLGLNTRTAMSTPTQSLSGGTNWKDVENGNGIMMRIRDDSSDPI